MCGIVGAIADKDIAELLVEGLKRLEYRGYDSAGIAVVHEQKIERLRVAGKVARLEEALQQQKLSGHLGIGHTRWATHGEPSTHNAHPHFSNEEIAIVHNGIIENYSELRQQLKSRGYRFESETDTEVIAHLIHYHSRQLDLLNAIRLTVQALEGAYSLAIISVKNPHQLFGVRSGSPLVVGLGKNANFLASDPLALLKHTQNFYYLEEGDVAVLEAGTLSIYDKSGVTIERKLHVVDANTQSTSKGEYPHYMLKEIFEQPQSLSDAIMGYVNDDHLMPNSFGHQASHIFPHIQRVHLVACGTSYHAALVARY
ncbi:MAG TPA: isomerizing glutamine--fructose-6-phosphate transaminase, partial [Coxiellaceae bacterium]|nr:isomerizing glutamine--fructose-6-phosphate transaminase [Coxiellaceae bacterium]